MLNQVIVIDDSQAIRDFLEEGLQSLGVEKVICFSGAIPALDYIKQHLSIIDGILTDLQMPEMDGLQLLEELGQLRYRGGVIIVSGMEERIVKLAVDIALSMQIHLVGSAEKPICLEKLKLQLERIIQLKGVPRKEICYVKKRELIESISQNRILPYYQPKVNLNTGKVIGIEVLCRLDHPHNNEIVTPERFIPVAEKFDLIDILTHQLMERAMSEYAEFRETFPQLDTKIAINISPQQLYRDTLPNLLCTLCELYEVDKKNLVIEITERQVITEKKQLTNMDRLRIRGFGVSLDDFGAGFTNIRQVRDYPFTEIKIDRGLVHHIASDKVSQVILNALNGIAKEFNMELVAEGIETVEDYCYMQNQQNITAQGFLISRPKPLPELIRWCHAWLKKHPI